jgi:hypothetical protein
MSTLPLHDELTEALQKDLWLIREAMAEEEPNLDDAGFYVVPARFYMPKLKMSLTTWEDAVLHAKTEIPKSVKFDAKQAARLGTVNSVAEVAKVAPEARRFWLVDLVHNLMSQAIEILENEGRPQPAAPPDLSLKPMRREGWRK